MPGPRKLLTRIPLPFFGQVVFGNRCPNCGEGKVFTGIYRVARFCSVCDLRYEKESGYFLGAIVGTYFLTVLFLIPMCVYLMWFLQLDVPRVVAITVLPLLLLHPFLFRTGKLLWLYVETNTDRALDRNLK